MTDPATPAPKRRYRLPVRVRYLILVGIVALVAIGWTVAWFMIRDAAARSFDATVARLAADENVTVTCAGRTVTGYPFRIDIACTGPRIVLSDGALLSAERLRIIGLAYNTSLAIAELDGPLDVTAADGTTIHAEFGLIEASVRWDDAGIERVSIVGYDLAVDTDLFVSADRFTATHAEIHFIPAPDSDTIEVAVAFDGAMAHRAGQPIASAPMAGGGTGHLIEGELLTYADADSFEAWRRAEGRLDIVTAQLALGGATFTASGAAAFDAAGRPTATLTIGATDGDTLSDARAAGEAVPATFVSIADGLRLVGQPTEDGGLSAMLTIANGVARVGTLAIGMLEPMVAPLEEPAAQ